MFENKSLRCVTKTKEDKNIVVCIRVLSVELAGRYDMNHVYTGSTQVEMKSNKKYA